MEEEKVINDIYEGELISAWKDDDSIYICFPWYTINFPLEDFDDVADELCELVQVWRGESTEEEIEPEVNNN